MKTLHEHKFKKDKLNLWCECGETKLLKCSHKWKVHREELITKTTSGVRVEQYVQTLFCKCGDIAFVNTTAGNIPS